MKFAYLHNRIASIVIIVVALASIAGLQHTYDKNKSAASGISLFSLPPDIVKMMDLGLHSAVASYAWVGTMPDILTFSDKDTSFLQGLKFVNAVDPRLSFPYSFSVIVLPVIGKYSDRVSSSLEIGARGLENADPDWKIPFYMGTTYYFERKDKKSALYYFDLAARTQGAPQYIKTFGENFGSAKRVRDETKSIWVALYQSATDDDTKEQALLHLERIKNLEFLEDASTIYKKQFGEYPKTPDGLVTKKIITEVPQDPFGFPYIIGSDGSAEVKVN